MEYSINVRKRNVPGEELVNDIKRVSSLQYQKFLSYKKYRELGGYFGLSLFSKNFGSWAKALHKAGLESFKTLPESETALLDNFKEVWDKLGKQPRVRDMKRPFSKFPSNQYKSQFGSWKNTLETFSLYINNKEEYEQLFSERPKPKRIKRSIGIKLRYNVFHRDYHKCVSCGRNPATDSSVELQVDHIIPLSKGGETIESNLQTLCKECNIGKSDREN